MPTNVYLSTDANERVDLTLRYLGPDRALDDHYHALQSSVAPNASEIQVLSIDRGGHMHPGDAVNVTELQLWVAGVFVGALAVMLDNSTDPVKDAIHWAWRVPTTAEGRWSDSHDPLNVKYSHSAAEVDFTVQGRGTVGFDDIYLTLTARVKGYSSLMAARDRRGGRIVTFASLLDGSGMLAISPMLDEGSAIPAWKAGPVRSDDGRRFVGSASVLTGFTTQPVYLAAHTEANELWIGTDQGATAARVSLQVPQGTVKAVSFSDIWLSGTQQVVDVFATSAVGGELRLYHRLLSLQPFKYLSDWDDWDAVVAPPAYCASRDSRYLFIPSPGGIVRGAGVYYTSASWGSTSWFPWVGLEGLPNGATTAALTAFPWYSDDKPQKEVGVICTATDGTAYFFTFDQPTPKWTKGTSGISGPVAVAAGTNSSPMAARGPTSILGGYNWVKEHVFSLGEVVPDSRGFGAFAVVQPFKEQSGVHAALIRQSDTGLGPAAVGIGGH